MIVMIWPLLGSIVGSLGSAAISRRWAIKDLKAQNEYNSPRAQVKRLKQAGLPLATMFGGQGGSTSDQPRSSEIDPSLGAARGMENYFQNRMQKAQLQLIDQQLREATAGADLKEGERDWYLNQKEKDQGWTVLEDNQERMLRNKRDRESSEAFIAGFESTMKGIESSVKEALNTQGKLYDSQIADLDLKLTQIAKNNQDILNMSEFIKMKDRVLKDIGKGGTGWQGISRLIRLVIAKSAMK